MAEIQMNRHPDTIDSIHQGVITELRQTKSEGSESEPGEQYFAPFGVNDENVRLFYTTSDDINAEYIEWGTLRDFFQEWLSFKNTWNNFITNGKFIQYSNENPISNNVKLLFEINDNIGTDNELTETVSTPSDNLGEGD